MPVSVLFYVSSEEDLLDVGCVARYAEADDGGAGSMLTSDDRLLGGLSRGGQGGRAEEGNGGPEECRELHFVSVVMIP